MAAETGASPAHGATEASEEALHRFRELVLAAGDASGLLEALDYLSAAIASRPFAAPLLNTAREILEALVSRPHGSIEEAKRTILDIVSSSLRRVLEETEAAAEIAARRLEDGDRVLTHSYSRSVLRALERAAAEGKRIRVIVAESRPLLDGVEAAKSLARVGIPVTLVVDSAARYMMREATKVLLGADAITADGSIVTRSGGGLIALAAAEARVRVLVVAGTYKLYPETVYGITVKTPSLRDEIVPRELRDRGVKGYAPLFETIPPGLVDALATERGLIAPEAVPLLIKEAYGSWPPTIKPLPTLFSEARQRILRLSSQDEGEAGEEKKGETG